MFSAPKNNLLGTMVSGAHNSWWLLYPPFGRFHIFHACQFYFVPFTKVLCTCIVCHLLIKIINYFIVSILVFAVQFLWVMFFYENVLQKWNFHNKTFWNTLFLSLDQNVPLTFDTNYHYFVEMCVHNSNPWWHHNMETSVVILAHRKGQQCRVLMSPLLLAWTICRHDEVIKWKHFPCYWPFLRGIHRSRWIPRTKASDA